MIWNFVTGPAGALCFGLALVLGMWAAVQRERSVPEDGGIAPPRPFLFAALAVTIVAGAVSTALRMGALT